MTATKNIENKSITNRLLGNFKGLPKPLMDNGLNQQEEEEPSNMSSLNRWYSSGRKRHFRRCNNEISKSYTCPYRNCGKTYGSEGSLNLHMKIKHKAGSKTEREKYAREIILSIRAGNNLSES